MGYLFENMEKMDIQEERRKTAEARRQLEEARKEIRLQTEKVQLQAEKLQRRTEETIAHILSLYQRMGESREAAARALMEVYHMEEPAAREAVSKYWK